ncbi:MAG TPA: PAS domain S-box protein, partial [Clostridia bacterium]|nr:PAS domain S-box protein [Clostridia bacterium]
NVGAERMLGYAAADVMNKITPADISDPEEVIARAKALSAELGTPITPGFEALVFKASREIEDIYELTYIRKDGSRFPAVVSVTALRDDQGAIIGYLLIGTDNTARKQIEEDRKLLDQRLRDQQFYTRSLFESNIDALVTTDPSGIISDVNRQMEELTGCTRDELIGSRFTRYFTDPERAEASLKLVLNQKKVTNYELTARARDGRETVVSYNATTYYDRDRRLQGMFAAARDITERKVLEESVRRRSAELSAANKELEAFSYSVSHDLRSPLRSIDGFSKAFLEDYGTLVPEEGRADLERVWRATERMGHLIDDMLLLARVTRSEMHVQTTDISAMAAEVAGDLRQENPQRDVQLTIEPGMTVTGDPQLLHIVLVNLLGNAWKFTSQREQAHISMGTVQDPEHGLAFFVRDDGAGFDQKYKDKLFVAFQRLHGQDEFPGTGIGLATIQRVIRRHGGDVWAEGEVNRGATFYFTIPDLYVSASAKEERP